MKVVFKIKEDDPRNPGVIADCTGDNAGDSVGPTADGFETYGVTGVALISFIALAVLPEHKAHLLVWIFVMRILMIVTSIVRLQRQRDDGARAEPGQGQDQLRGPADQPGVDDLAPLDRGHLRGLALDARRPGRGLWWKLSSIISCGTLAAALIPEFTKVFTSSHSRHTSEIVRRHPRRRRLAHHPLGHGGGQLLGVLEGADAGDHAADRLPGLAQGSGAVHGPRRGVRVRPGGVRPAWAWDRSRSRSTPTAR